ncbi:unnamed protein product, partial [Ilex paraguariensis]
MADQCGIPISELEIGLNDKGKKSKAHAKDSSSSMAMKGSSPKHQNTTTLAATIPVYSHGGQWAGSWDEGGKLTDSFRGVAGSFPVDKTGAFLPSAQNEGKADGRKWPTQKPKWRQIVQPGNQANPSSKEHEISRSHVKLKYCKPAKDGDEIFVSPPNEVAQKGYSNWEHCLVSYFVEKKLPYSVVNAIVHKICGQMGLME